MKEEDIFFLLYLPLFTAYFVVFCHMKPSIVLYSVGGILFQCDFCPRILEILPKTLRPVPPRTFPGDIYRFFKLSHLKLHMIPFRVYYH